MVYSIAKLILPPLIRLYVKEIRGKENIIRNTAFIIAANHSSYFDDLAIPCIVVPILNKKIHFYVNYRYFNNYFLKKFLEWGSSIPVDLTKSKKHKEINKKAFEIALKYLRNKEIIGIFPEGTRSIDGKLQKGKTGIAKLALEEKVPVLPIGIIGTNKILPKGSYFPRLKRCKIYIGKPIYFKEHYNKNPTKKILENITRKIMKEIGNLIGQKYNY